MKLITVTPGFDLKSVRRALTALGLWTTPHQAAEAASAAGSSAPVVLAVSPHSDEVPLSVLLEIEGVERVYADASGHPLMDAHSPSATLGAAVKLGGGAPSVLMAGPCSVESEEQIHQAAEMVKRAGASVLRGGCFKPRTNPYSFQGVGVEGLSWMSQAAKANGLLVVTEAMAPNHVDVVAEHADLFQIGARNMQNFDLLHAVGRAGKPVLLKRGLSATIEEWLQAAEHALYAGADQIVLCERGVRSFDPSTRFLFDLAAVALIRHVHDLPIIADPSHATGRKELIAPMGKAALAAGADGLIVEAHPEPGLACSDAAQQLDLEELLEASRQWGFC